MFLSHHVLISSRTQRVLGTFHRRSLGYTGWNVRLIAHICLMTNSILHKVLLRHPLLNFHLSSARWSVANRKIRLWLSYQRTVACRSVPNNGRWHSDTELTTVTQINEFRYSCSLSCFHYHWNAKNKNKKKTPSGAQTVWLHTSPLPMNAHFRNKSLSEHVISGVAITVWHLWQRLHEEELMGPEQGVNPWIPSALSHCVGYVF
jgi:hypothetical protein